MIKGNNGEREWHEGYRSMGLVMCTQECAKVKPEAEWA